MAEDVKLAGISGSSGYRKTTIIKRIKEMVDDVVFIPQDNYYKSVENLGNSNITDFNFDHPDAFNTALLQEQLRKLRAGNAVDMPTYDLVAFALRWSHRPAGFPLQSLSGPGGQVPPSPKAWRSSYIRQPPDMLQQTSACGGMNRRHTVNIKDD